MAATDSKPKLKVIDTQKRVIVPNEVLKALDVGIGDYLAFRIEDDAVRLYKADVGLKGPRKR